MGITIHYRFCLREDNSIHGLLAAVRAYAEARGWPVRDIDVADAHLQRSSNEGDWQYEGPSFGIETLPDEFCEPVRLEFGTDRFAFNFTKTQFAGAAVHQQIIELFDALRPFLTVIEVEDEAEYWETRDPVALAQHIATCGEMIQRGLAASPTARGPVRLASGRWADIVSQAP